MVVSKEKVEQMLSKMSRPLHYSYVSNYILKCSEEEAIKVLNKLVSDGILKEVKFNGYYVLSSYSGLEK